MTDGWLLRQAEEVEKAIKDWPIWMKLSYSSQDPTRSIVIMKKKLHDEK